MKMLMFWTALLIINSPHMHTRDERSLIFLILFFDATIIKKESHSFNIMFFMWQNLKKHFVHEIIFNIIFQHIMSRKMPHIKRIKYKQEIFWNYVLKVFHFFVISFLVAQQIFSCEIFNDAGMLHVFMYL